MKAYEGVEEAAARGVLWMDLAADGTARFVQCAQVSVQVSLARPRELVCAESVFHCQAGRWEYLAKSGELSIQLLRDEDISVWQVDEGIMLSGWDILGLHIRRARFEKAALLPSCR